jgi:NADH-quinone oxidoreductase subunit L
MDASMQPLIPLIPLLPLLGAALNGFFGHRLPRWLVTLVALGTVLGAFIISVMGVVELSQMPEGRTLVSDGYRWMQAGSLSVDVRLVIDRLSAVMIMVVTGVGFLIHLYSVGYMSHDPGYSRYFAYLNLFMFAMLVLVLGDSLPLLFVGWEGVGLCSYLLIGFWYTDSDKASAGKKAFIVNRIGDFGFLVAMGLLLRYGGTLNIVALKSVIAGNAAWATGGALNAIAIAAALLLVLGATGKSAQIPLYIWLPDAMAGPTPVSALIHAATMVTAGVYLTARMSFLFVQAPVAMLTLATIGAVTALFAASIGLVQNDIKKVLAYSTVSQLGFMFIAAGVGAYAIAVFHLVTHAFFKACLFLGSGSVIHGMSGEQDMRQMGGLHKKMPITSWTFIIATLAITGFPLLSGFISKDAILWNAFTADAGEHAHAFATAAKIIWALGVTAAGFTAFYMWRLVFMTFFSGKLRASDDVAHHVHESPWTMWVPLVLLAAASIVGGALAWPPFLGGHEWLANTWLTPVVGAGPAPEGHFVVLEWSLVLVSTVVAAIGFTFAYVLYAKAISPTTNKLASERPWSWLHARLYDKWHVDELYQAVVVRPLNWTSRVVLSDIIDKNIIDGLVNLVGYVARTVGVFVQVLQTGNIQRYIAIFAIALAVLIMGWVMPTRSVSVTPPVAAVVAPTPTPPAAPAMARANEAR